MGCVVAGHEEGGDTSGFPSLEGAERGALIAGVAMEIGATSFS